MCLKFALNYLLGYFTEAALDIFNCHSVVFSGNVLEHNTGSGRANISFRGNSGAVAIGYNNLSPHFTEPVLNVFNCTFYNNSASANGTHQGTQEIVSKGVFTGRGGGMAIYSNESHTVITISITDSVYEGNYARSYGGGLYIFFTETMMVYNNVQIKRTQFISNTARIKGGGLVFGYQISIVDCNFTNNSAVAGGGMFEYDILSNRKNVLHIFSHNNYYLHSHTLFFIQQIISETMPTLRTQSFLINR